MNFYVNVDHYSSTYLMHLVSLGFIGYWAGRFMSHFTFSTFLNVSLFFIPFSTAKTNLVSYQKANQSIINQSNQGLVSFC